MYYFKVFVGEKLYERTFTDFNKCRNEATKYGLLKFRDTEGNEYFI